MTYYRPRLLAGRLREALESMPVVVLSGLRQSGKTTFLQHEPELKGRRYFTFDEFAHLQAAREDPDGLIAGESPITLDEIQKWPDILPVIKRAVDRKRRPGQFILSGSANLGRLPHVSESLAGRAVYLTLGPFIRRELQGSAARPFLRAFFQKPSAALAPQRVHPIAPKEVLLGGMPSVALGEVKSPSIWFHGYEQTYLERDLAAIARVSDVVAFRNLLRLAALRTGQILNSSDLGRDVRLNSATTGRYLGWLEASYLISRLPPFLSNRASRLVKSPKLYLSDSGLAAHLAGVGSLDPDEPARGALVETYVAQNLAGLLACSWPEARLAYWCVQGRHEVDFVIEAGRDCIALEVKAAARWGDRDLSGLRAFLEATPRCRAALLAYNGQESVRLGERLWAVPLDVVLS